MVALAAALLLGAILRLVWPSDMEYRHDEMYLFHHATGSHRFPWLGENSGVDLPNPGMGIWVYSLMARVAHLTTPIQLVRGVMVLNIIALVALTAFALRVVPSRQREPWLWATALVAVNPLAVLFSRKLWIQSVLPPFVVAMLWAWWHRGQRWAAFAWGLVGAGLGQVHMSGFFFAGGFAAWTALFDRRSVRWRWWLAGSVLGALTLEPWLVHVLQMHSHRGPPTRTLDHSLYPRFWILWILNALGFSLVQLPGIGSKLGFPLHMLGWPSLGGTSLYLGAITVVVIAIVALAIAAQAIAVSVWPRLGRLRRSVRAWRSAGAWRSIRVWHSDTGLAIGASLWAFGLLITASGVVIYRHYLIVAFALPFVSIAVAALVSPSVGRRLLAVLVIAQAALSVQYLIYVHTQGKALGSDYGVPYNRQTSARPPSR
jgi:hypothetical protein